MAFSEGKNMVVSELILLYKLGSGRLSKLYSPVNIWTA